jgi:signal transduction histidine kinase
VRETSGGVLSKLATAGMQSDGVFFSTPSRIRVVLRLSGLAVFVIATVAAADADRRGLAFGLAVAGVASVLAAPVLRDRYPWLDPAAVGVFLATGCAMMLLVPRGAGWIAVLFTLTWAVTRLPWRWAAVVCVTSALLAGGITWYESGPGSAVGLAGGCLALTMFGVSIRQARSRAAAAEQARDATARAEVLAERQRLAREIHDILAHTLSAQVVQLEGARLLLRKGASADAVRERVEQAQRLAREGLAEIRQAVESLRGDTRPLAETLPRLAADSGARYEQRGTVRELGPEAAVAIQRTVQEALTNARKHAPGAAVTVRLEYGDGDCAVSVRDTGAAPGRPAPLGGTGGGYGLAGMRERAELLGGTLTAGPRPDGGFGVRLVLPA